MAYKIVHKAFRELGLTLNDIPLASNLESVIPN